MNPILEKLEEIITLLQLQVKPMLNTDEVCLMLGISKPYLYRLIAQGKVKCYCPFGKLKFFDKEELIETLKQTSLKTSKEIIELASNFIFNSSKK